MKVNINNYLSESSEPIVMGILNVTPDSFFSLSRCQTEEKIISRVSEIINQGGKVIDIGGYSTRPGALEISEKEEINRISFALKHIRKVFPDIILSIDTFRSEVARIAIENYNVSIINDISGGEIDTNMFNMAAKLNVPYILMHTKGTPSTMQQNTNYNNFIQDIFLYFAEKIKHLHMLGVSDIILDPGFGFAKTVDQNYKLLANLKCFSQFNLPLLVGVSRKKMIYEPLEKTPERSLNGTTIINTISVLNGANILRVHDVKEAIETIKLTKIYESNCKYGV